MESSFSSAITRAPSASSLFVPLEFGEKIEPGMAYTTLPSSTAASAVYIVPDLLPASVTTSTRERAAMSSFLRGKAHLLGPVPQGSTETTAPPHATAPSKTSREVLG